MPLDPAEVRSQFPGARGFLDTATIGLPPEVALRALNTAISDWRDGRVFAPVYDDWVSRGRAAFAGLIGVPAAQVAIGPQVSVFAGVVASSLRPGARVLCAEGDFTSVQFPMMVQRTRGVVVEAAPLERLADAIDSGTDLVAVSAVQSSDGRVADLDAIEAAARHHGAATLIDVTQGCGWLPVDASRFDYVVCAAYKWLLSPRGTAFLSIRPERMDDVAPILAGWYAGEDRWNSIYGEEMALAADARRFDISPAWLAWVGTAPALELLASVGPADINAHAVGLANALREQLGGPPSNSAIVTLQSPGARERLASAGIRASVRSSAVRLGFHLYNDADDVGMVVAALR